MPVKTATTKPRVSQGLKARTKARAQQDTGSIQENVDQYGTLSMEVDELLRKAAARGKKLREEAAEKAKGLQPLEDSIREEACQGLGVQDSREVVGRLFLARIGKQREPTVIQDYMEAFRLVTGAKVVGLQDDRVEIPLHRLELFLEEVGLPVGFLKKYLSGIEFERVTKKESGGDASRQFKVESRKEA